MALEQLQEPYDKLEKGTLEMRRAVASLIEEFEAMTWYQQRIDATKDPELKSILAHNRDEEKEHAAMLLEWIRRNDASAAMQFTDYLFSQGPITAIEEAEG